MSDANNNIKFIYIGNTETKRKIGDFPSDFDPSVNDIISKLYEKNINTKEINKFAFKNNQDTYVLINAQNKVLYLVVTAQTCKRDFVSQLFAELENNSVHLLTDSLGLLNDSGKRTLRDIVKNQENKKDIIHDINSSINEVKVELKENIRKQLANNENSEKLSEGASKLKDQANIFKNDANNLKKITCWQNCKWTIILVGVFLLLILIIVVPIIVSGSKVIPSGGSSSNSNTKSNSTMRFLTVEKI